MSESEWKNKLYFGDNLDIMRDYIADESVDLIYLDPPFNSNATYNILFAEKDGTQSAAQIEAFDDTWHWDMKAKAAYDDVVKDGPRKLSDLIQALHMFLGQNDMMAYLVMMAPRLVELHRVLKPTGSIYLHCDPTASHYLKILLDSRFDIQNFVNEIVWQKIRSSKAQTAGFGKVHDIILLYSKSGSTVFVPQRVGHSASYLASHYRYIEAEGDRRYRLDNFTQAGEGQPRRFGEQLIAPPPGKHWIWTQERIDEGMRLGLIVFSKAGMPSVKRYLDKVQGNFIEDIWTDISPINSMAKERLGYPTQKPEALLRRIVESSSKDGDLVLDPFCGCGTAISVAERLGRRWIGIDITHLAITLMRHRLEDAFGSELSLYDVIGDPKDLRSAESLAAQKDGRYQFEWWALGKLPAKPAQDKRKGADKGIDGIMQFNDDNSGQYKKIVVQVKSGHVTRNQIGDLRGVMEREKAVMSVFVTLEKATQPMYQEAAAAGFYEPQFYPGMRYPRIQIITVEELLNGHRVEYPRLAPDATFKRAERKRKTQEGEQSQLL